MFFALFLTNAQKGTLFLCIRTFLFKLDDFIMQLFKHEPQMQFTNFNQHKTTNGKTSYKKSIAKSEKEKGKT